MAATIGEGVEVRVSSIPNSGNGLFATRQFRKNSLITEYCGKIMSRIEADSSEDKSYLRGLDLQHSCIEGINIPVPGLGGGSFANDATSLELNNAKFAKKWSENLGRNILYLQALRPIQPGEEVFVSYGRDYWIRAGERAKPGPDIIDLTQNDVVDLTQVEIIDLTQ